MAYLIPKDPPDCFPKKLIQGTSFTIGRLPENDLCLSDTSVSRTHCEITWQNNSYAINDLESLNGTHLNGIPTSSGKLKHGDEIRVGNILMIFQELESVSGTGISPGVEEGSSKGSVFKQAEPPPSEAELDWADIARRVDELKPDDSKLIKSESKNFHLFREFSRIMIKATSEEELLEVAMDRIAGVLPIDVGGVFLRDAADPDRLVPKIIRGTISRASW